MTDRYPDFIRKIDDKGRLLVPSCIAPDLGPRVLCSPEPQGGLLIRSSLHGLRLKPTERNCGSRRVLIPVEHRRPTGLLPGSEVGMSITRRGLVVWALPEARVRHPLAAGAGSGETR